MKPTSYVAVIAYFSSFLLIASSDNDSAPQHSMKKENDISAVVLGNSESHLNTFMKEHQDQHLEGLYIVDVNLPGKESELDQKIKNLYFQQDWSPDLVKKIKTAIYDYYQQNGRPFIILSVPRQDRESKVFQIIVSESFLGNVEVVGNRWTKASRYQDYIQISEGEVISQKVLTKNLNFMNRNPFRRVGLIYKPGERKNTTSLILEVQDTKPVRVYTGFDNNGVDSTGQDRIYAGFSWDQAFGFDHVFSYQYTTNNHVSRFHANTFQYIAFLSNQTILELYGGFSKLHATLPSPNMINTGTNIQASARYRVPIPSFWGTDQEFIAGLDFKQTNNTMEFVDTTPIFGQIVNLTQAILGYRGKYERIERLLEWAAEIYFSPFKWLPHQSNADFQSLRPGAHNQWIYLSSFFKYQDVLPYSFSHRTFLQILVSSQPLLPSEQMCIGGYNSVRGYDERQYNADIGALFNYEIYTPYFPLLGRKTKDRARFLLFFDSGVGLDNQAVPQVPKSDYLIGVGPGFRYAFLSYFEARIDWGIKLHRQADFTGSWNRLHVNITGSY